MKARRQLLQFLAASPLLAGATPLSLLASVSDQAVTSPGDALDVFDFQRMARKILPIAHYGYIATGTDGNEILRAELAMVMGQMGTATLADITTRYVGRHPA